MRQLWQVSDRAERAMLAIGALSCMMILLIALAVFVG